MGSALALASVTILFKTADWGLHLHHYFLGICGYFGARGNSRVAAIARALCLGVFINGFTLWGEYTYLALWAAGEGWEPPTGVIETEGSSSGVMWTAAEVALGHRSVLLSWAMGDDVFTDNCSLPVIPPSSDEVFVVEMNHIEVYRGFQRSHNFTLP